MKSNVATSTNTAYLIPFMALLLIVSGCSQKPDTAAQRSIPDSVLFTSAPVLTPEQALQTFQLEPGFRIELVASEPLIHEPVAMDFDEQGRIWVVEMQGYMPNIEGTHEEDPTGRIVILEDSNGDGRMDTSKVFMDSLVLPRVIRIARGGVFYSEPPKLWFVENNHDKPGKKTLVDAEYAVGGNVEHQPNGMERNLDNWFYNAKSAKRYRYDKGKWINQETEFRGQWGITKDNYGRLYYNTNSNQLRGDLVPANKTLRNPNFTAELSVNHEIAANQHVYPIRPTPGVNRGYKDETLTPSGKLASFTAACAPLIYRGDAYPKAYLENAFVCEPSANLVKRNIMHESGAYVQARQAYEEREFLASTDERFRPVNLYNAPDGNMYLVDMYHGIIQHKTYLTDYLREEILSRGLNKPNGMGRIYRIVYEGNWLDRLVNSFKVEEKPDLHQASDEQLIGYLSHRNGWWRDQAQRLLVERNNPDNVPALQEIVRQGKSLAKVHALWTLEGMGVTSLEIIKMGIDAHNSKVVATALQVAERNAGTPDAAATLILYQKVTDTNRDALVNLQLALSLGEFVKTDQTKALDMLTTLAIEEGADPLMREALISSVYGKEKQMLAHLKKYAPAHPPVATELNQVVATVAMQNHLKGKSLSEKEQEQFAIGKSLFTNTCAGCHQENGKGLTPIAPPLAGSEWAQGPPERLIRIVLHGLKGPVSVSGKVYKEPNVQPLMPGLKDNPEFTDENLAAVLTYVRNAWINEADAIAPEQVTKIRESTSGREDPFTEQELKTLNAVVGK